MCDPKSAETTDQIAVADTNTESTPNEYTYNGYIIHETFDPDGPRFSDCIVRLFA